MKITFKQAIVIGDEECLVKKLFSTYRQDLHDEQLFIIEEPLAIVKSKISRVAVCIDIGYNNYIVNGRYINLTIIDIESTRLTFGRYVDYVVRRTYNNSITYLTRKQTFENMLSDDVATLFNDENSNDLVKSISEIFPGTFELVPLYTVKSFSN